MIHLLVISFIFVGIGIAVLAGPCLVFFGFVCMGPPAVVVGAILTVFVIASLNALASEIPSLHDFHLALNEVLNSW